MKLNSKTLALLMLILLASAFFFSEQSRLYLADLLSLPGNYHTIEAKTNNPDQGLINNEPSLLFQVRNNQSTTIKAIAL
ncbi:MAG: hypothetical protein PHN37_01065, partial [Candidatus Pacebacteria bacterium]|nr:hypothetical protein [Candidatus Paceibacterota bacterium]